MLFTSPLAFTAYRQLLLKKSEAAGGLRNQCVVYFAIYNSKYTTNTQKRQV
jgi:hypothetical protein